MKYLFFMIVLFVFCTSCNKDNGNQFIESIPIDLSVKNAQGDDLLNPATPNSLDENKIKLFYLINGDVVEFSGPVASDYPKGFFIYKNRNTYRIRIFPNIDKDEEFPITYIKWNSMDTDTIKCSILRKNNSEIIDKVWLNGKIAWNPSDNTERFIQIIK